MTMISKRQRLEARVRICDVLEVYVRDQISGEKARMVDSEDKLQQPFELHFYSFYFNGKVTGQRASRFEVLLSLLWTSSSFQQEEEHWSKVMRH